MNDKILNIYGQEYWHTDAKIIGNKLALTALRNLIDKAIELSTPVTYGETKMGDTAPLFASDGEGYKLTVVCTPTDDWDDKMWKDNPPEYTEVKAQEKYNPALNE